MASWQELADRYLMTTYRRLPLTVTHGRGVWLWHESEPNRRYLDFIGGFASASLGHAHPVLVEAITKQAQALVQPSNLLYTVPPVQLAQLLVQVSAGDSVFFCNSGAEANEGAIKLARKWGKLHRNGAYEIITAANSFHGRTLATTAATGQPRHQEPFTPMPEGFVHVPYDNIEAIKQATNERTVAVMLEPIQGEGGVIVPDDNYLRQVRQWCDEQHLLLILDEVQTGIGRTGTLFAYQQSGIEPDILTLAKGLGGGVPIGAIVAKDHAAVFEPGEHGSTFGGNPLACAAAHAVLTYILENDVLGNVQKRGEQLRQGLIEIQKTYFFIQGVRGRGLLQALDLQLDLAETVVLAAMDEFLLLNAVRPNVVRFMPPLIVSEREVSMALDIVERVMVWLDNISLSNE